MSRLSIYWSKSKDWLCPPIESSTEVMEMQPAELLDSSSEESEEKIDWIVGQVEEQFKFSQECHESLRKEAHTTLNWLLGVIVAPVGYAFSHLDSLPISVVVAIGGTVAMAIIAASRLVKHCMLATKIMGPGNTPFSLLDNRNFSHQSLREMRVAELLNVEERIYISRVENARCGSALNAVRLQFIRIPIVTAALWVIASICPRLWLLASALI